MTYDGKHANETDNDDDDNDDHGVDNDDIVMVMISL